MSASSGVPVDQHGNDDWIWRELLGDDYPDDALTADGWDESKHPRDEHGRFGEGGGANAADVLKIPSDLPTDIDPDKMSSKEINAWNARWDAEAAAAKQSVAETLATQMKSPTEDLVRVATAVDSQAQAVSLADNYGNNLAFIGRADDGTIWAVKEEMLNDKSGGPAIRGGIDETGEGHARQFGFDLHDLVRCDSPEADPLFREAATSALVAQWSITSNDSNDESLAMQQAVADEFNLTGYQQWDRGERPSQVADVYAENGAVYRDFARAQYENTQQQLADAGVKSVDLNRGFVWADSNGNDTPIPDWARHEGPASMPSRPISSWSSDLHTAEKFADSSDPTSTTLVKASIPADRILSTARSGVGALKESEFVILGGDLPVTVTRAATRG